MRFNPPPHWPVPAHGWFPDPTWSPDPSWPPAPPGWRFFVENHTADRTIPPPQPQRRASSPRRLGSLITIVAILGLLAGVGGYFYHRANQPDVVVLEPVDAAGNLKSGWIQDNSRSKELIDCSFGSPSPYDKTAGVRDCGSTADAGYACWPAADKLHVLCVVDPFSNRVSLIGAQGLNTERKPLTSDPVPFALVLDNGVQCQARHGGAWSSPKEHPDWVGFYGCHDVAVWGPRDAGIKKGFGGWTVEVGTEKGHLTTHKVKKIYYVGVAAPADDVGGQGGTRMVTRCGRAPELKPEAIHTDSGALIIRTKIVAHCPGGDVLSSPSTRITVTSGGHDIASGVFDLSSQPIVVGPGSGTGSEPAIEHDFRFPVGTFWRLPVSTQQVPTSASAQQGPVDIDVKTLVIDCDQSGSSRSEAMPSATSQSASTAVGPGSPASGNGESASGDALRAMANADRPFVSGRLTDTWVPQLSSKRLGMVAEGITWNNAEILREHLQLRLTNPEVRLLWSGDWSTFSAPDFWITIAGVTFPDAGGALAWCRSHNFDRDHCYAKLVSTTHPVDGTTAFNP